MDDASRARIRDIRSRIQGMLAERQLLPGASPSRYWSDFCEKFDYMLGLPEESFGKLRVHTHHLTGDNYHIYYFGDPDEFRAAHHLDALTADIPAAFVIDEPPGGIGFSYRPGRFVSMDILRYQRIINTLYRQGVLSTLRAKDATILEIGAGYGGLAYHLRRLCPGSTYVIVDIPETLLFSASYLTLQDPDRRLYLYAAGDVQELLHRGIAGAYDFVLLPDFRLEALRSMRFDLVINTASLQEMRTDQVATYLDFIQQTCRGVFYSWNQDHQPRNAELQSLSAMIHERFDVIPVAEWTPPLSPVQKLRQLAQDALRAAGRKVGVLEPARRQAPPYLEYLCTPRRQRSLSESPMIPSRSS